MISIFNKKSIAVTALTLSLFLAAGCSSTPDKSGTNSNATDSANKTNSQASISTTPANQTASDKNTGSNSSTSNKSQDKNTTPSQASTKNSGDTSQVKPSPTNGTVNASTSSQQSISEKVKNYILNGQGDKPEAQKIKWSKTFLDQVDIDSLYKQYKSKGGNADDLDSFAKYITQNAPIASNWQDLFKKDLNDTYGQKVSKLEHLDGDMYQAYIEQNGSQVPFVAVNSRTGYFHG